MNSDRLAAGDLYTATIWRTKMTNEPMFFVWLCGNTFKFRKCDDKKKKRISRFNRSSHHNDGYKLVSDDKVLEKSRDARIARAIKTIESIGSIPDKAITLTFAGIDNPTRLLLGYTDFVSIFTKFTRDLIRTFPDCWFYRKIEIKHANFYHYHMCGSLNAKNYMLPLDPLKARFEPRMTVLQELWLDNIEDGYRDLGIMYDITREEIKKAITIKPFHDQHWTYMTKPAKRDFDKRFIRENPGARMFDFINKKNVQFNEVYNAVIPESNFQRIAQIVCDGIDENCCDAENIYKRFQSNANQITYSKDNLMSRAVLHVIGNQE